MNGDGYADVIVGAHRYDAGEVDAGAAFVFLGNGGGTGRPVLSQQEPFVDGRRLAPGAFATLTDLALPWIAEGMSAFDRIVIDDLEQEAAMPQPMVSADLVSGDISGLVNGEIDGRSTESERIAFVFRGLALADLALAGLACLRALGDPRSARTSR